MKKDGTPSQQGIAFDNQFKLSVLFFIRAAAADGVPIKTAIDQLISNWAGRREPPLTKGEAAGVRETLRRRYHEWYAEL